MPDMARRQLLSMLGLGFSLALPARASNPPPPEGYPPAPEGYQYVPANSVAAQQGHLVPLEPPHASVHGIPKGYHFEEEPRRGLIIAGIILSGVPYTLGGLVAAGAGFKNASGLLMVPYVGPWMTLGLRNYSCNDTSSDSDTDNSWGCLADAMVVMALTVDGLLQAGGGAMILGGSLSPTRKLVRNGAVSWSLGPRPIGTGYGLGAMGQF